MKPSKIGIAIVAGAVALGALLFYANVRHDRRHIELLAAAPEFAETPVTVDFTVTIGDAFSLQIREAISSVNDDVGDCNMLTLSGDKPKIRIITSMDREPCPGVYTAAPTKAAHSYFCPDGTVDIVVNRVGHIREALLVFRHEFGHALGLPDGAEDVMAPAIFEEDWSATTRPLPRLPVAGARAIARRYCERGVDAGP